MCELAKFGNNQSIYHLNFHSFVFQIAQFVFANSQIGDFSSKSFSETNREIFAAMMIQ